VSDALRFRFDDLRRHATELTTGLGVAPARASALAAQLLWFDAAGASKFGIATLPSWLTRLAAREFEADAEGRVMVERSGTVALDGQNGLPPLLLERAGELAIEKAREAGLGLVRLGGVGTMGPGAAVAAGMAIGPCAALIVGPGPSCSVALPCDQGLPALFDSDLTCAALEPAHRSSGSLGFPSGLAPWAKVLAPAGGWLIAAVAIASWEPLTQFHARVAATLDNTAPGPGQLRPGDWAAHRRQVHDHGVALDPALRQELKHWAERLGLAPLAADADAH
jgi:LDH2 family malate/lactate/ureidoglycolate dehydrogenase